MSSSDRVCQFYLRGRCQRQNCEFRHVSPSAAVQSVAKPTTEDKSKNPICRFFQTGNCRFGDRCKFRHDPSALKAPLTAPDVDSEVVIPKPPLSVVSSVAGTDSDDESIMKKGIGDQSDEESINSGFTEASKILACNPAAKIEASISATDVNEKQDVATPTETVKASEADSIINNETKQFAPSLIRRAAKESVLTVAGTSEAAKTKMKIIRRDSRGIENFDDYFTDSETENSPQKQKTNDATVEEVSSNSNVVTEESISVQDDSIAEETAEKQQNSEEKIIMIKKKNEDLPVPTKLNQEESAAITAAAATAQQNEETIEDIASFIQDDAKGKEESTNEPVAYMEKGKGGKSKEEWVSLIFGQEASDDPNEIDKAQKKKKKKQQEEASVYDLLPDGEDFNDLTAPVTSTPAVSSVGSHAVDQDGRKNSRLVKKDGVTKIGNNTYFYTGNKTTGESTEDDEDDIGDGSLMTRSDIGDVGEDEYGFDVEESVEMERNVAGKKRTNRSYASGRRKHRTDYVYGAKSTAAKTRRCGECEGCNREDCGQCDNCKDKPKFGGKNSKKQACIYRLCTWKNPSGKKHGARSGKHPRNLAASEGTLVTPRLASTLIKTQETPLRKNDSNTTSETAVLKQDVKVQQGETPSPRGRPKRGRKSISVVSPAVPGTIKKGDDEYLVIVPGAKNTGLCGKYWVDVEALPNKRRRTTTAETTTTTVKETDMSRKSTVESKRILATKETIKKKSTDVAATTTPTTPTRSSKRKQEISNDWECDGGDKSEEQPPLKKINGKQPHDPTVDARSEITVAVMHDDSMRNKEKEKQLETTKTFSDNSSTTPLARKADSSDAFHNKAISCVAGDVSTQREVVVECFAPYDDHRWVNIGKERDGMNPDSVQYARALRPPYHLLSFLRIKGYSTKGMSCTDKNTMVFVVLEGEITVVLHTTQFNAKKGDSFYIPPKNYYNLINQKAREAELSLIQFQYDGPLPTVSAASQSGQSGSEQNSK